MKLALAAVVGAVAAVGGLTIWLLHKLEADLAGMRTL